MESRFRELLGEDDCEIAFAAGDYGYWFRVCAQALQ
jgi:hypothetical protein